MKRVVIVNSCSMGKGNEELGRSLTGVFFRKLWASETKPEAIIFYNEAVKFLAQGSAVLDALTALADLGVDLVACGTCVGYFELKDRIVVGRVSNMDEIVSQLMSADSVITI